MPTPDFDVVYAIRAQSAMMWRLAEHEASQLRWTSWARSVNPGQTHDLRQMSEFST